jgi:MSHA pilin protein MshD
MNQVTARSADPLIRKQALAIAESVLEEVELKPFTYCDPDDASAVAATSTAGCTTVEVAGVEDDVSRYDTSLPFDNVSDYNGFGMAAGSIMDITNTNIGLAGYTLQPVTVAAVDFGAITAASGDALLVTVTITDPGGNNIVLEGIRTRHSPRSVP